MQEIAIEFPKSCDRPCPNWDVTKLQSGMFPAWTEFTWTFLASGDLR
jgi:hypothetical protein